MGIEIERKFLVKDERWRALIETSRSCTQGYANLKGNGSIRIRILGDKGFLTLKGPREGIRRPEFEYEIPIADATSLLESFCDAAIISKIRHELRYEGNLWEIDEFLDNNKGLTLAEVELESEHQSVPLPEWVVKDVSEDERFFNAHLAKHPISSWSPEALRNKDPRGAKVP
jgi:adenylate cyclase